MTKIRTFKDLKAWQEAHKLVLLIYKITRVLPKRELYSLSDQMRRAVVSVSSNIAEGFARSTKKDKIHFYIMSLTSVIELQNQNQIALDLKYFTYKDYQEIENQLEIVRKLIYGIIRSSKSW